MRKLTKINESWSNFRKVQTQQAYYSDIFLLAENLTFQTLCSYFFLPRDVCHTCADLSLPTVNAIRVKGKSDNTSSERGSPCK